MISKFSIVSSKAKIGKNVSIGAFTTIYDNVEISDGTVIEGYCELGVTSDLSDKSPLRIGANSYIRSHSIFYEGSSFGPKLVTGHRVTVRENTVAGENLQIGTLSDIQGHCTIGDFVRFHSNVHIGQKSTIGNFVWIFPYVVLTNDPHPPSETLIGVTIKEFAVIATMSVVLPGAIIEKGVLVGAHSSIKGNTEEDMIYAGSPAKKICATDKIKITNTDDSAYPWRNHFKRGYPIEITESWN